METQQYFETRLDLFTWIQTIKKLWMAIFAIILGCTLVFFLTAYYVVNKSYEAIAQIIVVSKTSNEYISDLSYTDLQLSQKLTTTYAAIIKSERISDLVIARLNHKITPKQYRKLVRITAEQSTEIMNIVVQTNDPYFSSTVANEIVHVFLSEIKGIMPVENVNILTHAKVPMNASGPSLGLYSFVGAVVGMLASALFILHVIYSDQKVKTKDELKMIFPYPFIGEIPWIKETKEQDLLSIGNDVIVSEAYRTLRTNLQYRNFERPLKVLNIISSSMQEGKTSLLIQLAESFSQVGKRVLVVDLDLQSPSIHKKMQLCNDYGITDLLNEQASISLCLQTYKKHIDVITAGTAISNTNEFLESAILAKFIQTVKDEYDYILLDGAPAGFLSEGVITSKLADGTILVVANNMNERDELVKLNEIIQQFELHIIGIVMTKTQINRRLYQMYDANYRNRQTRTAKVPKQA